MASEIKRKLFHMLGLVYIGGPVFLHRKTFLLFLCVALTIVTLIETLRVFVPPINRWFLWHFDSLFRQAEHKRFSGVFWMLLGVLSAVVFLQPLPLFTAVMLYVLLGDTAASLVGQMWDSPRIFRTNKTLSGTTACFIVCMLVGLIMIKPQFGWTGVWIGAITATLAETGVLPLDDNFLIPFASSAAFSTLYHLPIVIF